MGVLLNMYGGAVSELEQDFAKRKAEFAELEAKYKSEKSDIRKEQMRLALENMKRGIEQTKEKINQLLSGVAETASKAYQGAKEKVSSGLTSLAGHFSSGISSLGSSVKGKYEDYKDTRSIKNYYSSKGKEAASQLKAKKLEEEMNKRLSRTSSVSSASSGYRMPSRPPSYSASSEF